MGEIRRAFNEPAIAVQGEDNLAKIRDIVWRRARQPDSPYGQDLLHLVDYPGRSPAAEMREPFKDNPKATPVFRSLGALIDLENGNGVITPEHLAAFEGAIKAADNETEGGRLSPRLPDLNQRLGRLGELQAAIINLSPDQQANLAKAGLALAQIISKRPDLANKIPDIADDLINAAVPANDEQGRKFRELYGALRTRGEISPEQVFDLRGVAKNLLGQIILESHESEAVRTYYARALTEPQNRNQQNDETARRLVNEILERNPDAVNYPPIRELMKTYGISPGPRYKL
jgi:hypothetical protein